MSDTAKRTNAARDGLKKIIAQIPPWALAAKTFEADGQVVDVEHATDAQFQMLVAQIGVRVNDQGIAEWSFDDRCGVLYHAMVSGKTIPWKDTNNSLSELFVTAEHATQADPHPLDSCAEERQDQRPVRSYPDLKGE